MTDGFWRRENQQPQLSKERVSPSIMESVGADTLTLTRGTYTDPYNYWAGNDSNNNVKTDDLQFETFVPVGHADYASIRTDLGETTAQADITLKVYAKVTGTPATSATLTAACYRSLGDGTVDTSIGSSGNIVTTGSQSLTTSWTEFSFTIDGTDIVEGDYLNVRIRAVNNDTGGSGGGHVLIGDVGWWYYERG